MVSDKSVKTVTAFLQDLVKGEKINVVLRNSLSEG